MKKKVLSLALALVMVLAMAIPAFAADTAITPASDPKTGATAMTYTVAASYTVTIPEAITIDAGTKAGEISVGLSANALIDYGTSINVALTTCDFLLTNNDDSIAYTVTNDADTEVALNDTVLTQAAGTLTAASETLNIDVTGLAKYSGAYTDSVTFTVSVA